MLKHKWKIAAIVGLAGLSGAAFAGSSPDKQGLPETYFYVGGHISEYYYDITSHSNQRLTKANDERLEPTTLGGVQIGWRFAPNWSAQIWWERDTFDAENPHGAHDFINAGHIDNYLVSGRYHFEHKAWHGIEPYLGFGVGEIRLDWDDAPSGSTYHNDRRTVLAPVAGVQVKVFPHVAVDAGVRPAWVMDSKRWDTELFLGINFMFGSHYPVAHHPKVVPIVLDADHDGVKDSVDSCLGSPAGVQVYSNGCALDSDHDHIPNYRDQCKGTAMGAIVDNKGCQKMTQKIIRQIIHVPFASGQATVKKSSYQSIQRVAGFIKQYPYAKVILKGYTDDRGSAMNNIELSRQRAQAVKDVLVNYYGIFAGRMTVKGLGESDPIADNNIASGRALNRRVEVVLKATKDVPKFH